MSCGIYKATEFCVKNFAPKLKYVGPFTLRSLIGQRLIFLQKSGQWLFSPGSWWFDFLPVSNQFGSEFMKAFNRFTTVLPTCGGFLPVFGGFTGFIMQPGAAAVRFYLKTGSWLEKNPFFTG